MNFSIEDIPMNVAILKLTDDGDFIFIDLNKRALDYEKLLKKDILGKNIVDFFPGLNAIGFLDVLTKVSKTGIEEEFDLDLYEDSIKSRWNRRKVSRLKNGSILVLYDNVAAKDSYIEKFEKQLLRKTQEIEKQNRAFETLFEKSSDGILIIEDAKFVQCNEKIVEMLRYTSKEELLHVHPSKLSPEYQPDGKKSFEKADEMMRLALSNNGHSFEWIHTKADGEDFYSEIVLTPISLLDRDIIHVVWRDISQKKELEQKLLELNSTLESDVKNKTLELKKREELLSKIFDETTESIAILDLNLNFLLVNNAYQKMTGFTKKELYSTSCRELTAKEYLKESEEVKEIVLREGKYIGFEKKCMDKKGKSIDVKMNIVLMPDKKTFLVTVQDITLQNIQKKEKENQDKKMLQQSRLAQMGEMISMIAHQWRQPLSAISSTTANLEVKFELDTFNFDSKKNIQESKDYIVESLGEIDEFVESLTTTIDDFRNFYKPNKEAVKTTLKEIALKALRIIETSLVNSDIEIVQEYDSNEVISIYDSELIQVILNILKNAQDNFKEKNTQNPKIIIRTYEKFISICDNGGGIPHAILEKIFNPYFSTKDEKNGTGLGLYMSKIIVEEHHSGKLNAVNTKNGICFSIDLNGGGVNKSENI